MNYLREQSLGTRVTPQSEAIPGSDQVANSAGGYSWNVGPMERLRRFLILGSEGGTYYIKERKLTKQNAAAVRAALDEFGMEAVKVIRDVSVEGRAPKQDPALYALAMASGHPNPVVRAAALQAVPDVCRTGTTLLHFVAFAEMFRGHGPALNRALARWYTREDVDGVAYQLVKYRERDGWAARDVLRLARPKPPTVAHDALFRWAIEQTHEVKGARSEAYGVHGTEADLPRIVEGFIKAQEAKTAKETAQLVRQYHLPREALNTEHLKSADVWEALLYEGGRHGMPLTAMIRNLPTMTRIGLLAPFSSHLAEVTQRLGDDEYLRAARVHPLSLLVALLTYKNGKSVRGSSTWEPVSPVVDALDAAFYLAFPNVERTGKRFLLAVDVSSSMTWDNVNGVPGLTPRVAAAAMALVTAATEPNHYIMAFSDGLVPVEVSPRQRLDDVVRTFSGLSFGGTDCALPMLWASGFVPRGAPQRQTMGGRLSWVQVMDDTGDAVPLDTFIVYTDAETWAGSIHPSQALVKYREKVGVNARLVVVGMTSNGFTIADPNDPGMLDVVGFDTSTPQVISDFSAGRL
jgi:60 kDa SS-A/Ro ribonucleoprotein